MSVGIPWLVTWSTYGIWLPGDPRGFQTRRQREYVPPPARYARQGEQTYAPDDYRDRFLMASELSGGPVRLAPEQQRVVIDATVARLSRMAPRVRPFLLVLGSWHVHIVARFGGPAIRRAAGQLKQASSIALGVPPPGRPRWWAEGCHMKSLPDRQVLDNALGYLWKHVEEGDMYYQWKESPGT